MGVKILGKDGKPQPHPADEFGDHLGGNPASTGAIGTVQVQKELSQGPNVPKKIIPMVDESEEVSMPPGVGGESMCRLEVGGGRTINLGNFNSARIHVGLSMPTSKSDLEDSYTFAFAWVSEKIEGVIKEMQD